MATQEAKIVVDIERGAFKSSLRGMESDVAASGKRMKSSLSSAMTAGLGNVKNSMKGMLSGIGGHMKTLATFGGAIGAGMLVRDALHLQTLYRNIAYNVGKIPGQAMKWQDVQSLVNKTVERTGGKAEDLAMAFDHVFKETGRLDVAKGTLEAIGTMATSTGGSMEAFADVATRAVEKFNIGVDRLPEALAQFESLTGVGGPQLDELGRKFGMMAGAAADAGLTGEEGMRTVLTMMTKVDDLIGEKAEPALKSLFQEMATGGKSVEAIEKKMGRKFGKGEGAREKMGAILARGGSVRDEFIKSLSADAALGFKQLVPAFDDAMRDALAAGKSKQEATAIAVKAFDDSITGAGRKTRTYAENVTAATKRLKEDPALQLQKAMNKLQKVMTSPQALASIKKLMDVLPPLAEKMAQLLGFIMDHPLLAGGVAIGGKLGASYASGAIGNLLFGGGAGAGAGLGAGASSGGPSRAGYSAKQLGMTPAKMTMTGGGKMIVTPGTGWPMVPPSETKMKMTGQQIGGGIASSVAALGVGVAIGSAISGVLQDAADRMTKRENRDIKRYDNIRGMINSGDYTGAQKALKRVGTDEADLAFGDLSSKLNTGLEFLSSMLPGGGSSPLDEARANKARRQTTAAELATAMANESAKSADMMIELKKVFEKGIKVDTSGSDSGGGGSRGPKSKPKPTPGAAPKAD